MSLLFGLGELFDITEARQALQNTRMELVAECEANSKLQRRFDLINSQIRQKNIEQNTAMSLYSSRGKSTGTILQTRYCEMENN